MKKAVPILDASSGMPPGEPGLRLAARAVHDAGGAWIHGSFSLPEARAPELPQQLLRVFLVAISRTNQIPQAAALVRQRGFLLEPESSAAARNSRRIGFAAHTADLFAHPLHDDTYDVHAVCGEQVSSPLVLEKGKPAPANPAKTAGDALLAAYDRFRERKFAEAVEAFATALAKPLKAELDAAHRYNAACAAARAGTADLRKQALKWLAEDLKTRAEAHRRRSQAWAAAKASVAEQEIIDSLYRGHIRFMLEDQDLAGLPLEDLLKTS